VKAFLVTLLFVAHFIGPAALAQETQVSHGHGRDYVWVRDAQHPLLGEAWRDEAGVVWGDLAKDPSGRPLQLVHSSEYLAQIGVPLPAGEIGAVEYCRSLGAELPTGVDIERLFQMMSTLSYDEWLVEIRKCEENWEPNVDCRPRSFVQQVLPNFEGFNIISSATEQNGTLVLGLNAQSYQDFDTTPGFIYAIYRTDPQFRFTVRCVVR
jgi:hypothetical protein